MKLLRIILSLLLVNVACGLALAQDAPPSLQPFDFDDFGDSTQLPLPAQLHHQLKIFQHHHLLLQIE